MWYMTSKHMIIAWCKFGQQNFCWNHLNCDGRSYCSYFWNRRNKKLNQTSMDFLDTRFPQFTRLITLSSWLSGSGARFVSHPSLKLLDKFSQVLYQLTLFFWLIIETYLQKWPLIFPYSFILAILLGHIPVAVFALL